MSSCGWVVALPLGRRGHHRQGDDAGVYTNRWKWPLGAILGHLCTLLRCCGQPWGRRSVHKLAKMASRSYFGAFVYTVATREDRSSDRGDAGVYTDRSKWSLGAVLGHLCTLLRRESRYESRRELRQMARAPQSPRRAGASSSLAPLAWSGRQTLREWRRCQVGIFAEASTHTNPRRALK